VTNFPYTGNSLIENLFCTLNETIYTFGVEISLMTGADIDYIIGIFNGTVNPPFMHPLDCIESELLSFKLLRQNIAENSIPQLQNLVQKSPSK
jgi:hypothetical protein